MSVQDQYIIKKINTEQSFSDIVFKSARAERFGITYCCPLDVENASIKKELCDWEDLRLPVYLGKTIVEEEWLHADGLPAPSWVSLDCGTDGFPGDCYEPTKQCILFEVQNQNGSPIEGYTIVVDGGNVGVTDEYGNFRYSMLNADTNTNHLFDFCYCFTTTGLCDQKKITVTLTEECPAEVCVPPEEICEVVEPVEPPCDTESGPTNWPFGSEPCAFGTMQCHWEFTDIKINGVQAGIGDYIGCFSPTTNALCGWTKIVAFPVVVEVIGNDFITPCTSTYIVTDEVPRWGIYDSSECTYCEATPSIIEGFVHSNYYVVPEIECL